MKREMGNQPSWRETLGISSVIEYVKYSLECSDVPIISVGSGRGIDERVIEKETKTTIICVDPDPFSFSVNLERKEEHLPDFDSCETLIKKKPELVGKCHLLLIWPPPNESMFDINAISLLKPQKIIVVFESTGSSGGFCLRNWIESIGGPKLDFLDHKEQYSTSFPKEKYKIEGQKGCYLQGDAKITSFYQYCMLITREDIPVKQGLPQNSFFARKLEKLLR